MRVGWRRLESVPDSSAPAGTGQRDTAGWVPGGVPRKGLFCQRVGRLRIGSTPKAPSCPARSGKPGALVAEPGWARAGAQHGEGRGGDRRSEGTRKEAGPRRLPPAPPRPRVAAARSCAAQGTKRSHEWGRGGGGAGGNVGALALRFQGRLEGPTEGSTPQVEKTITPDMAAAGDSA